MHGRAAAVDADGVPLVGSALYATKAYWEARFEREEAKEWLCAYSDIEAPLRALIPDLHARVLLVGCGNSALGADMVAAGYADVVATDFSETVVAAMAARHAALRPALRYEVADMLDLAPFAAARFDAVIDKAGFDAVVADGGADKWTPTAAAEAAADRLNAAVARVLAPRGVFAQITFAQPHFRRPLLTRAGSPWRSCAVTPVDVGLGYTFLGFRRGAD